MAPLDRVIVISVSGRALAQSASKCARQVIVLDAFADQDTRAVVAQTFTVNKADSPSLSPRRIARALHECGGNPETTDIVIGSGLEAHQPWVRSLSAYGRVLVCDAFDDRDDVSVLACFGWEVPETRQQHPEQLEAWLIKRLHRSGGLHVRPAASVSHMRGAYYQKRIEGVPMSVTFLADGARAIVLGFNQLLTEHVDDSPYAYAGVVSGAQLSEKVANTIVRCVQRMVPHLRLRGLCGVDFILTNDGPVALELNTRPTASFECYDDIVPEGLVRWHVESFRREMPEFESTIKPGQGRSRGLRVVYSRAPTTVPESFAFPQWSCDIPTPGTKIPRGAPICSVQAEGDDARIVANTLVARAEEMLQRLHAAGA